MDGYFKSMADIHEYIQSAMATFDINLICMG